MNTLSIVTVSLDDGSKQQHEIDYDRKDSRIWLAKHSRWALCNRRAVLTLPKSGADKIFLGHADDIGDVDSVANL